MSTQDLMFSYEDENGEKKHKVYALIYDFTDDIEEQAETAPPLSGKDVDAYFFENPLTKKHFETVEDLYYHCKMIFNNPPLN